MTALLTDDGRDPGDCPYSWGLGYDPCAYHDLPIHTCLIQAGHDNPCLCMCGVVPPPVLARPQRVRWSGWLDECTFMWPNNAPCVPETPAADQHMCVDGNDRVDLGHDAHDEIYHTCRCGARSRQVSLELLARRERRYRRDAARS